MASDRVVYRLVASGPGGANAPVTLTIEGRPGKLMLLGLLSVSYSAAAAGRLTITANDAVRFDVDITAAGLTTIPVPPDGIGISPGSDAVITLAAGGAAVIGKINAAVGYVDQ